MNRNIFNMIPLHVLCKGIIFYATIVSAGCNQRKDTTPANVSLTWENNRATGLSVDRNFLAGVPEDSIQSWLNIRLSGNDQQAIPGAYTITSSHILFEPLIPFTRGLRYQVYLQQKLLAEIDIPKDTTIPRLMAIYPRGDSLPENLLKIYLEFSQPMMEGRSQEYIHLLDDKGDSLQNTFLHLHSELWNEEGTVLSLWFDPGRIKRDLQPNKTLGPPLVHNRYYQLVIDSAWPDRQGTTLGHSYRKRFIATLRDTVSPVPEMWKLTIPQKSTRQPLIIETHESLDYYLLLNTISLLGPSGDKITGEIQIPKGESTYSFVPEKPWLTGKYTLLIESRLADLAGNNLDRLFDVDLEKSQSLPKSKDMVEIKWQIN